MNCNTVTYPELPQSEWKKIRRALEDLNDTPCKGHSEHRNMGCTCHGRLEQIKVVRSLGYPLGKAIGIVDTYRG